MRRVDRTADRARWIEHERLEKMAEQAAIDEACRRHEARRAHRFEQLAFWLSPWQVAGHPGEEGRP